MSISAVDENGFVIQYDRVELPNHALKSAIVAIHREARNDIHLRGILGH